jgi:hypothetical protein
MTWNGGSISNVTDNHKNLQLVPKEYGIGSSPDRSTEESNYIVWGDPNGTN